MPSTPNAEKRVRKCCCPICTMNEGRRRVLAALALMELAADAWIEHGADDESTLYFLLDEVRAAVKMEPRAARKRLVRALDIIDKTPRLDWMNAVTSWRRPDE